MWNMKALWLTVAAGGKQEKNENGWHSKCTGQIDQKFSQESQFVLFEICYLDNNTVSKHIFIIYLLNTK